MARHRIYYEDDFRDGIYRPPGHRPRVQTKKWLDVSWQFTERTPLGKLTGFEVVILNGADPDDPSTYIRTPEIVAPDVRRYTVSVAIGTDLTNARSAVRALYGGAESAWTVQGIGQVLSQDPLDLATLQDAIDAQNAADVAQADAAAALADLEDIGANGKLHPGEKQTAIRRYQELTDEQAGIDIVAVSLGITTEKTDYDNALAALTSYLEGLAPAWDDTTVVTTISRTVWNSNWNAVYQTKSALMNKIAVVNAAVANAAQLSADDALSKAQNNAQALTDTAAALQSDIEANTGAIAQEVDDRIAALSAEASARAQAILDEEADRDAAISSEASARVSADATEANNRELLATQMRGSYTGGDLSQVASGLIAAERNARTTQFESVVQQVALLSAGVGEQFDYAKIWYWTDDREGWIGNGGVQPTVSSSWLRPNYEGGTWIIYSPVTLAVNGDEYRQIRLRVRKTGSVSWDVRMWYLSDGGTNWSTNGNTPLLEPAWDGDIGVIILDVPWTGTIDRIRLSSATPQTATDYIEFDWLAIGRPAPGASSAALANEAIARASADTAQTTARETLAVKLTGQQDPSGATLPSLSSGLIYDEREARATAVGNEATARQQLQAQLRGNYTGTNPDQLTTGLLYNERQARVSAEEAIAEDVSVIQARMPAGSGDLATASALAATNSTVSSHGNTLSSHSSSLTSLQNSLDGKASTSALAALDSRVDQTESGITTFKASFTVALNANGVATGFTSETNGTTGTFSILANKFSVIDPTDASSWMQFANGALEISGRVKSSLLEGSAISQGSCVIRCASGRSAPFRIREMKMSDSHSTETSRTCTVTGLVSPTNGSGFNGKRLSEFKKDIFITVFVSGGGDDDTVLVERQVNGGSWATMRTVTLKATSRASRTYLYRYTSPASWSTIAIRARTTAGKTESLGLLVEVDNTLRSGNTAGSFSTSETASNPPPSGGPGDEWCVDWETTVLPDGRYVRDLAPGDIVDGWDEDGENPGVVPLTLRHLAVGVERCYLLVSGGENLIIQSESTPMVLRDGRVVRTTEMKGEQVLSRDGLEWLVVDRVLHLGIRKVCKPDFGNAMFFAGMAGQGRWIATHNIEYKP